MENTSHQGLNWLQVPELANVDRSVNLLVQVIYKKLKMHAMGLARKLQ